MNMNNKGFTLVEVMAGFSLLVVLMVSFVKIIKMSSELTTAAVDAKNMTLEFYNKYYSGENYYYNGNKNKPAFRLSKNNEDTVLDINGNPLVINISEYRPDDETSETDGASTELLNYNLSNVKLKKIENIYDDTITKVSVFRYVRE